MGNLTIINRLGLEMTEESSVVHDGSFP